MINRRHQKLLSYFEKENHCAFKLARLTSFAVRIDPYLLRRIRLELLPDLDTGVEADLWFSPIVNFRTPEGIVFIPELASLLRKSLAKESESQNEKESLYQLSWKITSEVHRNLSPAIRLEEEIFFLEYSKDTNSKQRIRELIRTALLAMISEDRSGLAHWAARALPKFPSFVKDMEEVNMLSVGAQMRLDREPLKAIPILQVLQPDRVSWIAPSDLPRLPIRVKLFLKILVIGDIESEKDSHIIEIPRTDPLVLEVGSAETTPEEVSSKKAFAIKKWHLIELGVKASDAVKYLADLNQLLPEYAVDTELRIAHFIAQILHESNYMRTVQENLNYSEDSLLRVFGKYFTSSETKAYARKPKDIASRVYGGRMGNGVESTGDGWRYRGRGLILLTGKSNYRKFSDWIGDDVVAQPDLVATEYAVHSAVYYWTSNDLNRYADGDDVKKITRNISGGLYELADRNAILDKAKRILGIEFAPELLENEPVSFRRFTFQPGERIRVEISTGKIILRTILGEEYRLESKVRQLYHSKIYNPYHSVTAKWLNLRSRPQPSASTRICVLPFGTHVALIESTHSDWANVRAVLNGQIVEGYVASKYLQPLAEVPTEPTSVYQENSINFEIPSVHLEENRSDITRFRDGGRIYPLGEANRPGRSNGKPENRIKSILKIIRYLDSENKHHKRYNPTQKINYCNIYAYDFCYLAGVYLPRVWWNEKALQQISNDEAVTIQYEKTVREINTNMLFDWFEEYGSLFGWKRAFDLDVLQAAANKGEVCVIVAKRKNLNYSGNITVVAPEHDGFAANRNSAGEVQRPLESQAGRKNHLFFVNIRRWWLGSHFFNHGFWRHY